MTLFAGLDVSVRETSVCVVDDTGKMVAERKVATEPDNLIELLGSISSGHSAPASGGARGRRRRLR